MTQLQSIKSKFSSSISFKLTIIALLIILLQIPLSYVRGLIYERQSIQSQTETEISNLWGGPQHIGAPMVTVEYEKNIPLENIKAPNDKVSYQYQANVLSQSFNADIQLDAKKRYLGIYQVPVFTAKTSITGTVEIKPKLNLGQVDNWSVQALFIPIKEMRGLKSIDKLLINGQKVKLSHHKKILHGLTGININLHHLLQKPVINYQVDLTLSGSNQIDVIPLAGQSNISMKSNWPSPSFVGGFLPEQRVINDTGFQASWLVNELNHNFGRVFKGDKSYSLTNSPSNFGVKIIIPANIYQVNERTVKYGLLIMLLTFAGFFLAEMFFSLKFHPFQYILIGFALSVFFLMLLALSEYLRFGLAFLLSATSIVVLVGGYCSVVLKQRKRGVYTGLLFALLYGFIYIMVNAEQASLLMGAVGIWLFLAAVMYLTRKIDWYAVSSDNHGA